MKLVLLNVCVRGIMTLPQVTVNCCLTSLHNVTNVTRDVTEMTVPEMAGVRGDAGGSVSLVVAHGVVLALSTTGNALVLYVIGRHLGYRTTTNVYITTLCVADVATALVSLLVAGACVTSLACVTYDVVRRSLSLVSTCMTSALVVERYMTVVRLHRVQTSTYLPRTLITTKGQSEFKRRFRGHARQP